MNQSLWLAVIMAGLLSLVAAFGLRPLLLSIRAFDVPTHRSSHSKPTLRGGGVAPLLGVLGGGICAALVLNGMASLIVGVIVSAAAIMSLVGFAEDVRGLRVTVRAGLQLIIGAASATAFGAVTGIHWLWIPVAALFFAANVNITNFMDGVNGISGLHGLVAGLFYSALGFISDLSSLIVIGLIIAVAFAAFLPWNFAPPGMFLGDVGSYLLGGALGATAIAALSVGLNPVSALAPLSIYWADAVTTLFRRAARGEPVFEAHRSHAYQRLTNTGFSHISVAVTMATFTATAGAVGILVATSAIHVALGALLVVVTAVVFLLLPRLRGDVLRAAVTDELSVVEPPSPTRAREDWKPTKWVVVGASGFIGRATVAYLREQGVEVIELSAPRLTLEPKIFDGQRVAELAVSQPAANALMEALVGVDVVINAAGQATPDGGADARLFGANAFLPAVIATAAARAGVRRFIHLSSAAVQGDRPVLDASANVSPFSPYSRSKALGERALLAVANAALGDTDVLILRATSVQGSGRPTTDALRRFARSPLASVAAPGDYPSVVSSVGGLVSFVHELGASTDSLDPIVLQPWEGLNVCQVLELAGERRPIVLPKWVCRTVVDVGKVFGRAVPKVAGLVRRLDVMWFGQTQESSSLRADSREPNREFVRQVLRNGEVSQ